MIPGTAEAAATIRLTGKRALEQGWEKVYERELSRASEDDAPESTPPDRSLGTIGGT